MSGKRMYPVSEAASKFSIRLIMAREAKDWAQKELSYRADVPIPTLSQLENKHRLPSLDTIIKLADVLQVSVDYLIGRDRIPESAGPDILEFFHDLASLPDAERKQLLDFKNFLKQQVKE